MSIKIDYNRTRSERLEDKTNRIFLNLIYSFVFLLLAVLITVNYDPVEKIDPVLKQHVTVLNIVQENIKSGFREPLIYDLEYIVPALAQYGFTTKDYYKAIKFSKNNPNVIRNKNGFFYVKRIRK